MKKELWEWLTEHENLPEGELHQKLLDERNDIKQNSDLELESGIELSDIKTWWQNLRTTSHGLMAELLTDFSKHFPSPENLIGKSLGSYTITKLIGEGGMGQVFLAERNDGVFERKVAIKLMRFTLNTGQLNERFSSEQRILASLNHASIAQLYDASLSESGFPYFVMEWIEGLSLRQYLEEAQLDFSKLMKLFIQICEGVEYAHKNLVIHKDLKPGNILVDKSGRPRILDFGISIFLEDVENKDSLRPITKAYASPELINNENVNTGTDIFSLGIILFELLTGTHPFNSDIQTNEERLSQIEKGLISIKFSDEVPSGKREELESVLKNTLQFNPENRYTSVTDLKHDIERILSNRPISLWERRSGYSLKKWTQRNKGVSFLTAIMVVASLIFGFIYLSQISKEREVALEEARKASVTKDYLLDLFRMADPLDKPGEEQSLLDFLDAGISDLSALDSEPEVKEDASYTLAQVAYNLGAYEISDSLLQVSFEINEYLNDKQTAQQATIMDWRADIKVQQGSFRESKSLAEASLEIKRNIFKADDPEMEISYSLLSTNYARLEMLDSAIFYLDKAEEIVQQNPEIDQERLIALTQNLATLSRNQEDYERSIELLNELVQLIKNDPKDKDRELATAYNNLGFSYRQLGNYEIAAQAYDSSLKILERVFGEAHPNTFTVMGNFGVALTLAGELERAEETYIARLGNIEAYFGESHWRTGQAQFGLGGFYKRINELEKARESYAASVEIYVGSLGEAHFWTNRARLFLASVMENKNESSALFKKSTESIKNELTEPLSYYDIDGLENLLKELSVLEREDLENELSSFLKWYELKFAE